MKKIDLSKIKFGKTPCKEITVTLCGEAQKFEVRPVFGKALMTTALLQEKAKNNVADSYETILEIISFGCDIPREAAAVILDADFKAAMEISNEIMELTQDFLNAKSEEEEDAKLSLQGKKK